MAKSNLSLTLGWDVQTSEITTNGIIIPGYKAITRSDDGSVLHVAKSSYTPTPNARLMDVVAKIQETTGMPFQGVGEVKGGKKIIAFLQANEGQDLLGFKMKNYMSVGNSHDGTSGFFIGTTNVMARCENQFSQINQKMKVFHTKNHDVKIEEIIHYLNAYKAEQDALYKKMEDYSKVKISADIKEALVKNLLRQERPDVKVVGKQKKEDMLEFLASIERECNDLGHNVFGLFQGVTHYTTHVRKAKDEKIFGNILGTMADMNRKALEFCDTLVY
jgi:acetolactate synthase small subunit